MSRGRSPAPNTCSVREHVRELSRGRSPSNVDLYSSRESLRTREKSPLARKLEKEGKVKCEAIEVFDLLGKEPEVRSLKPPSSRSIESCNTWKCADKLLNYRWYKIHHLYINM